MCLPACTVLTRAGKHAASYSTAGNVSRLDQLQQVTAALCCYKGIECLTGMLITMLCLLPS
jgi:hypothetical protein